MLRVNIEIVIDQTLQTAVEWDRLRLGLSQRPEDVDLADIMYQGEQSPLYIHFAFNRPSNFLHFLM